MKTQLFHRIPVFVLFLQLFAWLSPNVAFGQGQGLGTPPTIGDIGAIRGADPNDLFPTRITIGFKLDSILPQNGFALYLHATNSTNPPTLFTIHVGDISLDTSVASSLFWICTKEQNIPMDLSSPLTVTLDSIITDGGTTKFYSNSYSVTDILEDVASNIGSAQQGFSPTNNDNAKPKEAIVFLNQDGTIVEVGVAWKNLDQALTGKDLQLDYMLEFNNGTNLEFVEVKGTTTDQIGGDIVYFPHKLNIPASVYGNDTDNIKIKWANVTQTSDKKLLSNTKRIHKSDVKFVRIN